MAAPDDIRSIDVILTAGCNLRCSYCYQNDKKSRVMTWSTLKAAADLLLRSRHPSVRMLFVGGEPLLEFDLIRRAVAYIEAAPRPKPRVGFDLITNGTLLEESRTAFLAKHAFDVQLSFDGVPAAQNLRGRGTFDLLDALLTRLRRDHPVFFSDNLVIGITVLPRTLGTLADSIDYFLQKRVTRIAFSPAVTYQPDWQPERIAELDRQFRRIYRSSLRYFRRTGQVPLVLFRKTEQPASPHRGDGRAMCGVGRGENPAVDVDGEVLGCVMFAPSYQVFPTMFLKSRLEAMQMGNVESPGLPTRMHAYPAAAREARLFHDKQDKYSSYGVCRDCRYLHECGVCPVSIGHIPGNTDPHRVPDFLCAYNLVTLAYRDRFPTQATFRDRLVGRAPMPAAMRALLGATHGRIAGEAAARAQRPVRES